MVTTRTTPSGPSRFAPIRVKPLPPPGHRRRVARLGLQPLLWGWAWLVASATAHAQQWQIETSLGLEETITNNVNLQPSSTRTSDWVTQLTPGLHVHESGAHTSLDAFIAVPILLYARTGS